MSQNDDNQATAPPPLPTFNPTNVQTYAASCHCGIVSYTVDLSPPLSEWKVVSCNCSICQRNGYYLVYPSREQLHITSGEDVLKSYAFGPKKNLHKFCGQCGSSVFFDPRMKEFGEGGGLDLLGINVRMFHDVSLEELSVGHIENRSKDDKTSKESKD
ncbi:Mss4-like protein [Boeremia exigua]|uniref:Mss4-like protein n=1 Tax=Boeremia exigua TaxID=749465 RepID=UPI001E8EBC5F|nr:Mss4-like protein [Boeremia exigua]KAH6618809.1 Mss4-like protein [Boeremia exigua]